MSLYETFQQVQRRQEFGRQGPKLVRTRNVVVLEGRGRFTFDEPVSFGVAFRTKPDLSWLVEEESWDGDDRPGVSVGVREWVRDAQGNYTGAKVWVTVT